uniref:Uncharacterized protein n=1 Tax=Tanacetum cinerariifolium TaxID=118510 RepID=A0A6L2JQM9_TANCI|nr:hypothetical protein [Tanacetum cinerariifolium]
MLEKKVTCMSSSSGDIFRIPSMLSRWSFKDMQTSWANEVSFVPLGDVTLQLTEKVESEAAVLAWTIYPEDLADISDGLTDTSGGPDGYIWILTNISEGLTDISEGPDRYISKGLTDISMCPGGYIRETQVNIREPGQGLSVPKDLFTAFAFTSQKNVMTDIFKGLTDISGDLTDISEGLTDTSGVMMAISDGLKDIFGCPDGYIRRTDEYIRGTKILTDISEGLTDIFGILTDISKGLTDISGGPDRYISKGVMDIYLRPDRYIQVSSRIYPRDSSIYPGVLADISRGLTDIFGRTKNVVTDISEILRDISKGLTDISGGPDGYLS